MKLPVRPIPAGESDAAQLDVVVLHTTPSLTRAALHTTARLASGLRPLTRIIRLAEVPFPLPLHLPPVPSSHLRKEIEPIASAFGAHVQICFCREPRLALLELISCRSLVVVATERRWFHTLRHTREERLARWLRSQGYSVVFEFVNR